MRRFQILALLFIFLCFLGIGIASGFRLIGSGGVVTGSSCDTCTGGLIASWHMENVDPTLGTPCGCETEDGDGVWSLISNATLSNTDSPFDGSYHLYLDGGYDRASIGVTSNLINEGRVRIRVKISSFAVGDVIWSITGLANEDYVELKMFDAIDDCRMNLVHEGSNAGSTQAIIADTSGRSDGTQYFCVDAKWKVSATGNDMVVDVYDSDCSSNGVQATADGITAPTNTASSVEIGKNATNTLFGWTDYIEIWNTSGL